MFMSLPTEARECCLPGPVPKLLKVTKSCTVVPFLNAGLFLSLHFALL